MSNREILEKISKLESELRELKSGLVKNFSFSNITFQDLENLFKIEKDYSNFSFENWFSEKELKNEDKNFLNALLQKEKPLLKSYNEEELKIQFLSPILNRVDFRGDSFRAFYEHKIELKRESFSLSGSVDFFVAKGFERASNPIFFIQEFKRGILFSDPEPQLIAEMIAGLEISKLNQIKGAFIVGSIWNFVILEKVDETYKYTVSENFDSSKIADLEAIYKNLLFVKKEVVEIFGGKNG
jgi:uncharacterized protein YfkK (UPF0435 family)